LARSIFVTWLNGVPYDTRDSSFLNEMKLTAAEYQTHSLAIANNHYDKDAASEAKLRVLVDFCDAYAQWQPDDNLSVSAGAAAAASGRGAGGKEAKAAATVTLSENLDSDEDDEAAGEDDVKARSSSSPVARKPAGAAASHDAAAQQSRLVGEHQEEVKDQDGDVAMEASSADVGDKAGAGSAAASSVDTGREIKRSSSTRAAKTIKATQANRSQPVAAASAGAAGVGSSSSAASRKPLASQRGSKKRKRRDLSDHDESGSDSSSSSSSSDPESDSDNDDDADAFKQDNEKEYLPDRIVAKKTVQWQDYYLVHWIGFTAAERTWEPAAFFDQYCTKQTYGYQQARRPLRIMAQKVRPPRFGPKQPRGAASAGGGKAETFFYELQWQGQSETTMEAEEDLRQAYPDLIKTWQQQQQQQQQQVERKSVGKQPRSAKASNPGHTAAAGEADQDDGRAAAKLRAKGGEPVVKSRRMGEGVSVVAGTAVAVVAGPVGAGPVDAGAAAEGAASASLASASA
jgi:hypothetical protein